MNAQIVGEDGIFATSLRVEKGLITSLGQRPKQQDIQINLEGAFIFPGLINAHDHLEHNHYGPVKFQEKYSNASEWSKDVNSRLNTDANLVEGKSKPLSDRLLIGGIKNLLSGVTTVAHHNPFYRELRWPFPIRIVRNYGWAHSLYLQSGKAGANSESAGNIIERYTSTPKNFPFIIHLAEGIDEFARTEFQVLEKLGCIGPNTVLVHGIGLDPKDWINLTRSGSGLIWCPASNIFLIGQTIPASQFLATGNPEQLALGSDSRLTGSRDLLEEMQKAMDIGQVTAKEIFHLVTKNPARLLRLPGAGKLSPGFPADLLIIPPLYADPFITLTTCSRKDILLVTINGEPRYGSPQLSEVFTALKANSNFIEVDGAIMLLGQPWADRLRSCSISEAGVVCFKDERYT